MYTQTIQDAIDNYHSELVPTVHILVSSSLRHGSALGAEVSLGTLGKRAVKHGGVSSKSHGTKDEEGKRKLLSSSSLDSSAVRRPSARDNNLSSLVVCSSFQ